MPVDVEAIRRKLEDPNYQYSNWADTVHDLLDEIEQLRAENKRLIEERNEADDRMEEVAEEDNRLRQENRQLEAKVAETEALSTYIAALNTLQERWALSSTEHQADDSDRFAVLIDDAGGIVGYGATPSAAMKAALDKYYEQGG